MAELLRVESGFESGDSLLLQVPAGLRLMAGRIANVFVSKMETHGRVVCRLRWYWPRNGITVEVDSAGSTGGTSPESPLRDQKNGQGPEG